MLSNKHLYGLLSYDNSYNLGDEIQSIAAKQFLPFVDYLIDRDTSKMVDLSSECVNIHKVRTIYNGWFDGQYCQFPPPEMIDPLFISFHINETDHSTDELYSFLDSHKISLKPIATNVSYLKSFEPIGCRDYHTVNLLTKNGISCYFSGCLTLTLQNKFTTRSNEILVVDCHLMCNDLFEKIVPKEIRKKAIYISQAVEIIYSHEKKMELAQAFLNRLAQAKLVITCRLHTAMPCLAYQTPVIFIHNNLKDVRFQGLIDYVKSYTDGDHLDVDLLTYKNPDRPQLDIIRNNLKLEVFKWLDKNPFQGLSGCSIISACMDRNDHLEKALPTWLAANPSEIIIIDWGSKIPIKPIIDKHNKDNKITLITIKNVNKWVLTRSFNLAAKFSRYENILKLDCDSLLDKDFFLYHNLRDKNRNVYFTGSWKKARNDNEKHTNGIVYMKREDFFRVGGYNEFITTYGYDDCDLYNRLEKDSEQLLINLDLVKHQPHTNINRFINQSLGSQYRLDTEIEQNRLISDKIVWKGQFSSFDIKQISSIEYVGDILYSVELSDKIKEDCLEKAIKNRSYAKTIKKLYIHPKNGLGNRLRALASAYNIAKETGRQLVIIWIPDVHCNAKLTEIFKLNFLLKDTQIIDNIDEINEFGNPDEYQIGENGSVYSGKLIYNYMTHKDHYIDDTSSNDIYVISACILKNSHTNWHKESKFIQHLEPVDEIASEIYKFEIQYDIEKAIGIHIRMGQPMETAVYENTKTWAQESQHSIELWRSHSHYSVFMKEMDRILLENPKQKFFLCCDNANIYDEIIKTKKYDIIYTPKTIYDRSCKQIQSAVLDLILLSKCQYILGSNWSSFTEIAHRLSNKQLKLAGINFK